MLRSIDLTSSSLVLSRHPPNHAILDNPTATWTEVKATTTPLALRAWLLHFVTTVRHEAGKQSKSLVRRYKDGHDQEVGNAPLWATAKQSVYLNCPRTTTCHRAFRDWFVQQTDVNKLPWRPSEKWKYVSQWSFPERENDDQRLKGWIKASTMTKKSEKVTPTTQTLTTQTLTTAPAHTKLRTKKTKSSMTTTPTREQPDRLQKRKLWCSRWQRRQRRPWQSHPWPKRQLQLQ